MALSVEKDRSESLLGEARRGNGEEKLQVASVNNAFKKFC